MSHLISFEGIDASGKTTQIQRLQPWLSQQNIDVCHVREPGGTLVADKVRELLLQQEKKSFTAQTEVLLFYAARVNLLELLVKPALQSGSWVIADRYIDSTRAYQQSETLLVKQLEQVLKPPVPTITFFLDISSELAKARMIARMQNNRFDKVPQQNLDLIIKAYKNIAQLEKNRFVTIDATQSIEKIEKDIRNAIAAKLLL